jgi:diguanylate cyclase (GGDEF)-like protein
MEHRVRRRLSLKFTLFVALLLAGYTSLLVTVTGAASRTDLREALAETARERAQMLATTAENFLNRGELLDLSLVLEGVSEQSGLKTASVYDARREFLVDGDPSTRERIVRDLQSPLARRALARAAPQSALDGGEIRIALPIIREGVMLGVLEAGMSVGDSGAVMSAATTRAMLTGGIFLAIGLGFTFWIMESMTGPIRRLTAITERVAAGDLDLEIEVGGDDEVASLARSYRHMVESLRSSLKEVRRLDQEDTITALPNRKALVAHLGRLLERGDGVGREGALMLFDIDHFKRVNDTLGHTAGDDLLHSIAMRVHAQLRAREGAGPEAHPVLARLGGDEFAILLPGVERAAAVGSIANRILKSLEEPFEVADKTVVVSCSFGIALYPADGHNAETLMRNADIALNNAKTAGRRRYSVYSRAMSDKAQRRLSLEIELREALAAQQFLLEYQPQIACATRRLVGAEALVRWQHPVRGRVSPGEFIPLAEETGIITELGDWVVRTACRQSRAWADAGTPLPIAVNISLAQFVRRDFADSLLGIIAEERADPRLIEIEITETLAMDDVDGLIDRLAPLRDRGMRIAIDDFGTGYSSLSCLSRLPVDVFKIDRSFVKSVGQDAEADAIVRTIFALARHLGCETVAEGIETAQQLEFVTRAGCEVAQGFLFSPALGPDAFNEWRDRFEAGAARTAQQELQRRLKSAS